ncbi:hypothetical protein [Devosia sp.]|uniref:hypothetical protein n=1 Tax=Devosia sp. TaxID=1871048 RepID=UPI00292E42B0|nr:hypothetical protein [Devosia sp.]
MSSATNSRRLIEHLPLVDLMHFASYAKSRLDNPATNRTTFGNERDESAKKFLGRVIRLEAYLGTFLLERSVRDPRTNTEMAFRPRNPEELAWILSQITRSGKSTGKPQVNSELTLDGKIWASFAQNIFTLFDLTEHATAQLAADPDSTPLVAEILENELAARQVDEAAAYSWNEYKPGAGRPPWAPKTPVQSAQRSDAVAERRIPTRNHPWDREKYLIWLSHQTTEIADAWRDADETSVFDLAFRVPGVVNPETIERPEWVSKPPPAETPPPARFVTLMNEVAALLAAEERDEPHSIPNISDAFDASKRTKGGQVSAARKKQQAADRKYRLAPDGSKPSPDDPPALWSSQSKPTP